MLTPILSSAEVASFSGSASLPQLRLPALAGTEAEPLIGWKEWITLTDFGGMRLRAKVDTGARTSALHVENLEIVPQEDGHGHAATFHIPQGESGLKIKLNITDFRMVMDSGGHVEKRPFVSTRVRLGSIEWAVEVSLTNRASMRYSMLLGRKAIAHRFVVHPTSAYLWKRTRTPAPVL